MSAHFSALALEADPARFDQVCDGNNCFACAAAATAHQLDEFTQIVDRPLYFAWGLFHFGFLFSECLADAVPCDRLSFHSL